MLKIHVPIRLRPWLKFLITFKYTIKNNKRTTNPATAVATNYPIHGTEKKVAFFLESDLGDARTLPYLQ